MGPISNVFLVLNFRPFGSVLVNLDSCLADSSKAIGNFIVTATFTLKGAVTVFGTMGQWDLLRMFSLNRLFNFRPFGRVLVNFDNCLAGSSEAIGHLQL